MFWIKSRSLVQHYREGSKADKILHGEIQSFHLLDAARYLELRLLKVTIKFTYGKLTNGCVHMLFISQEYGDCMCVVVTTGSKVMRFSLTLVAHISTQYCIAA